MTTDIDTAPTRLSENELADHLSEILDRVASGERVLIERDGKDIVVLEPAPEPKKYWTWGEFIHWLQTEADFDEEFVKTVRELRKSQPMAGAIEWSE